MGLSGYADRDVRGEPERHDSQAFTTCPTLRREKRRRLSHIGKTTPREIT